MVFMGYPEKIGVTFLGLLERKKVSPKKSRFTSVDSEISEFFYFCFWKRTDVIAIIDTDSDEKTHDPLFEDWGGGGEEGGGIVF